MLQNINITVAVNFFLHLQLFFCLDPLCGSVFLLLQQKGFFSFKENMQFQKNVQYFNNSSEPS